MKYLSKKKQTEIRMLVDLVIATLPLHIKDLDVLGLLYDKLSRIVKASHSSEEYLEWLQEQVDKTVKSRHE